jgi:hypothetical protein
MFQAVAGSERFRIDSSLEPPQYEVQACIATIGSGRKWESAFARYASFGETDFA